MTYRPYPNVDRARAQAARHYPPAPVVELACLRPLADSLAQLRVNARRAAEQGFGFKTDEYRLSTRDEHTFEYGDDHVQRCTRCRHPHSQWAGGPCPGVPQDWALGSYV